jgi:hypothetical protein
LVGIVLSTNYYSACPNLYPIISISERTLIIKAVSAKLASSKEENPVIEVKNIKVPNYLDDYIYRLQPEKDIWYVDVYTWRYQKKSVTFKYVD